jgi:hypothetical protein
MEQIVADYKADFAPGRIHPQTDGGQLLFGFM